MNDLLKKQIDQINRALFKSWSIKSSSKWRINNPAKGKCGVTALVVYDFLEGEIMKTKLHDGWHFYNYINGKRYDLTASQFEKDINYLDIPSNRDEAFSDTNEKQYNYLKHSVLNKLNIVSN
ncbi:YunG family protein [Heyndrickxia sporothermodurans]